MTQTIETPEVDATLQKARNIVADTYLKVETARGKKPDSFATFAAWGQHIDDYSRFLREGAYDDDIAVQSALAALQSVQP
jgi:hypothetical protein